MRTLHLCEFEILYRTEQTVSRTKHAEDDTDFDVNTSIYLVPQFNKVKKDIATTKVILNLGVSIFLD